MGQGRNEEKKHNKLWLKKKYMQINRSESCPWQHLSTPGMHFYLINSFVSAKDEEYVRSASLSKEF